MTQQHDALDVTVIVPVHNGAETVGQTLASVAAQTRQPARVIVVDDASTDDSVEVARRSGLPQLDVIALRPNRGVGGARNAGASSSSTTWLAFLDADDSWEPTFLEEVVGAAEELGADFASSGGIREMVNKPTIVRLIEGPAAGADRTREFWRIARRFMPIVPSSAVVSRSLFTKAGGFEDDVRWGEEVPLFARLWLEGSFAFVNRPLYRSGQRPGGMSAVRRSYRDTALHLSRLGDTLLRAALKRKPGTASFAREYVRRVYRKHRNWVGGIVRSRRRRHA
jgi:glycosyltransferase involved in cell wall biosynthesis